MAKHDKIQNDDLRQRIDEAYGLMRQGNGTGAVHKLCESYALLLELKPEFMKRRIKLRFMEFSAAMRWPMLGANLKPESIASGKPEFDFVRERFAVSEAMMYYEFTVETALSLNA